MGVFHANSGLKIMVLLYFKVMAFIIAPLTSDAPRLFGYHDRQTGALSPSPAATCRFCPTIAFGDAFGSPRDRSSNAGVGGV